MVDYLIELKLEREIAKVLTMLNEIIICLLCTHVLRIYMGMSNLGRSFKSHENFLKVLMYLYLYLIHTPCQIQSEIALSYMPYRFNVPLGKRGHDNF